MTRLFLAGLSIVGIVSLTGLSGCQVSPNQQANAASIAVSPPPQPAGSGGQAEKQQDAPGPILVIGDSILKWNAEEKASIPEVVGQTLGRPVINNAVSGAHFSHPDEDAAAAGYDIRQQYNNQQWDWVVMNGGANDINGICDRNDYSTFVDAMISEDGLSGEIPDFVRRVAETGSSVMYVGYYTIPEDALFGFAQCSDELEIHNDRLARMAEALEGVWFVSAGDVVSASDVEAYDEDRVHPSAVGSKRVGEYVADTIEEIEERVSSSL
ncbi:MAG: SGNH/GDSL hydrolase family protein [Elainellaceae cyanobacterium]